MTAGYSGTPLAKKLGVRSGDVVAVIDDPGHFVTLLAPLPGGVSFRSDLRGKPDLVILFSVAARKLARRAPVVARVIHPDRVLWVAWPKRASGVATDITEDVVRDVVLPLGLVDVKVAAIDETWSGLKVVHRRTNR